MAGEYNLSQHLVADTRQIRHELGFTEQTPADIALSRTIEWELRNLPQEFDLNDFRYDLEDALLAQRGTN